MKTKAAAVKVDDQVFVTGVVDEVGAVREAHADHLIVYIENGGDVRIEPKHVASSSPGKLTLDPTTFSAELRAMVKAAHRNEDDKDHSAEGKR